MSHYEEEEDNALKTEGSKAAAAKESEETEGTRGGKSFCALKEEIERGCH